MLVTKVTVKLHRGLQARNTALFVDKACSFTSDVVLSKSGISSDKKAYESDGFECEGW